MYDIVLTTSHHNINACTMFVVLISGRQGRLRKREREGVGIRAGLREINNATAHH
jgi:hypothetical protein